MAADAVLPGGTKDHCQQKIRGSCRCEQYAAVHIRIKDTADDRYTATRQQPESQYTARQGKGEQEKQQRQPQQLSLSTISDQRQQHTHRYFNKWLRKKSASGQKDCHGIDSSGKGRQQVTPTAQRDSRQAGCCEKEDIIHENIQHQYAVQIYNGHRSPPFPVALL